MSLLTLQSSRADWWGRRSAKVCHLPLPNNSVTHARELSGRGVLGKCPAFSTHSCLSHVTISQATFPFHFEQEKKE